MRATQHIVVVALAAGTTAIIGTGAAIAATTSSSAHTLRFTSTTTSTTQFGPRFVSADKDVKDRHVIGNDVLSAEVTYTAKVHSIKGALAVALKGGEIYAAITGNPDTNKLSGHLSGGSGQYKGISGTISGKPVKGSNNEERLVIRYH